MILNLIFTFLSFVCWPSASNRNKALMACVKIFTPMIAKSDKGLLFWSLVEIAVTVLCSLKHPQM